MKAEENVVDEWMKQSVRKEICYRIGVWCSITIIVLYISSLAPSFALEEYVVPFVKKLYDQLNFIWAFLYFLILISFFFKDMAYIKKEKWGNKSNRHIVGMLLKKITSEILLWSAGISISLVTIIVLCFPVILFTHDNSDFSTFLLSAFIILFTLFFTAIILSLYYHLRIDRPTISRLTNSYILTKAIYCLLLLGCVVLYIWIDAR